MTTPPSSPPDPPATDALRVMLESIRSHVRALTVAVWILALAVFLTAAAVFGNLVNYFAGEPLMFGGASAGAAVLGFIFGWLARRTA